MKNLIIAASLCVFFLGTAFGCKKNPTAPQNEEEEVYDSTAVDKYIVFFLTNTSVAQALSPSAGKDANTAYNFVNELPYLFGNIKRSDKYKYAFGLPGPMLLTQSLSEMRDQMNKAFDAAEKYNVPVYFQLDDCNNYTTEFGGGAEQKFYENPDWVEWVDFPKEGEAWGGQSNGRAPYFWFNWGAWMHAKAFPSFQSPGFREFIVRRLKEGVVSTLKDRYQRLKTLKKEYLFAGVAIGWETHIPDYSSSNTVSNVSPQNLPVNSLAGDTMKIWEAAKYGYNSLHTLGKTEYSRDVLNQVIHDYSELLAKTVYESGIPRNKIFTHIVGFISAFPDLKTTFIPPIWTAVNEYSTPGFTMSPITCPYNVDVIKAEIKKKDPVQQHFGNVEGYSRGVDGNYTDASNYLSSMFNNGALLVSVFGWGREPATSEFAVSHSKTSPFVQAAQNWLKK